MSLSDLASLGSFVSGIAVLVSLVFLYFQVRQVNQQVRQTERNQRATIAQVRASRTVDILLRRTEPSVATAVQKAMGGAIDLTPTELAQFLSYFRAFLVNNEDTFLQGRHGLLEETTYRYYLTRVRAVMSNPGFRSAWRMARRDFGNEFTAFIDELIAETPIRPPVSVTDNLAEWRSGLAELAQAV